MTNPEDRLTSAPDPPAWQAPPPAHPDAHLVTGIPPGGHSPYGPHPAQLVPGPFALGITALTLGIASMVLAFVPLVNIAVAVLGLAGIVVAIIALSRKNRPKKAAIWGLGLSIGGSILAVIMTLAYTTFLLGQLTDGWETVDPAAAEVISDANPELARQVPHPYAADDPGGIGHDDDRVVEPV